jgi:hypothetical protein
MTSSISNFIQSIFVLLIQFYLIFSLINSTDNNYYKLIIFICIPLIIIITSFYIFYLINTIYNIFVPKKWIEQDSETLTFSKKNLTDKFLNDFFNKNESNDIILTIQIPVYDELFDKVICKTLENLLNTCNNFNNRFDKKINMLICDDGLQSLNDVEEIENRINFYNKHYEISYIGRQKNGRKGKFKKASNLNFSLNIINEIKTKKIDILSQEKNFLYKLNENFELGKYILLFDSDSQINIGIIQNLIYELMSSSNKICYLQCRTSSNLVCFNKWEKIISHFTNSIYEISFLYSASNGNPAPLVGHNCILNWKLITKILNKSNNIYNYEINKISDYIEYWNENGVSEDFSLSLDLYIKGYYGKYIYFDYGFKEGVTLNIDDEIVKFSKYAFGVNEIMFYPINRWHIDGILSSRIIQFIMTKKIQFHIKLSILSYIGIYYSMATSPLISFINFYLFDFNTKNIIKNIITTVIIFFILTIISNIIVRIRHKEYTNLFKIITDEIYYDVMLLVFFSGMQYFFLKAIICHFFDIKVNWGSTNKHLINNTIIEKLIIYKDLYLVSFITLVIIVLSIYIDRKYLNIYSIFPLGLNLFCHTVMPLIFY